jgi:hypothetical protein
MGMHLRAQEPNDPFGPMVTFTDGRSAAPVDFHGEPVEVLAQMAARAKHPVLRARLADACWLPDRKRAQGRWRLPRMSRSSSRSMPAR